MDIRKLSLAVNNAIHGLRSGLTGGYHGGDQKHQGAWDDYGYPEDIQFIQYWNMYRRNGIAYRGVVAPIDECWRTDPMVVSGDDVDEAAERTPTEFERKVTALARDKKLFQRIQAADLRQRVGRYGALIVQVAGGGDEVDWSKELGRIRDTQIAQYIPAFEGQLEVGTWETSPTSRRYGMPLTYNFNESATGGRSTEHNRSMVIHHSRVIPLAEGADDGTIFGISSLESGFNALLNIEKIIGAAGEGAWKNAAQKIIFNDDNQDGYEPTEEEQDKQDEALKAFTENLDKHLYTGGMKANLMQSNVGDPTPAFNIALNEFAASVSQPAKILIGAQTGRLAADEDGNAWLRNCQSRRESWCSDAVRSVIDWHIEHGALPKTDYSVHWDDLLAPGDTDKFELADKLAMVNQKMVLYGEVFSVNEVRAIAGFEPKDEPEPLPDDEVESEDVEGEEAQE